MDKKPKQFIYFPSLSSGNSKGWLIKDSPLPNGVTTRFYDDSYPKQFQHKYFLLSAGHNLSYPNLRKDLGLEDSFVIGDSGGFQICTGAMKWKPEVREKIFHWLENNSDIAMNLDIPPRGKNFKFEEALDISYENFEYFHKNQTGKTKFLNVLQGSNHDEQKVWFNRVKNFDFYGWAIGGVIGNPLLMMESMVMLMENGELDKPNTEYVHCLGAASLKEFFIVATLQKIFNEKYDNRITITTDSSSPNRATIFGTKYFDNDFHNMKLISNYFGKEGRTDYKPNTQLSCAVNCPACADTTYDVFNEEKWKEDQYTVLTSHNMAVTSTAHRVINGMLEAHDDYVKEIVNKDLWQLHQIINKIFKSDNPRKLMDTYKPILIKLCGDKSKSTTIEPETFFNF